MRTVGPIIRNKRLVRVGSIHKNEAAFYRLHKPPQRWETTDEINTRCEELKQTLLERSGAESVDALIKEDQQQLQNAQHERLTAFEPGVFEAHYRHALYMLLDDRGDIYLLNQQTLSLDNKIGVLPICGRPPTNNPDKLLAYEVTGFVFDGQYVGCIATSLSRDMRELAVARYDATGHQNFGKTIFRTLDGHQGGRAALLGNGLIEQLHPWSLSLLSTLLGPRTQAIRGYRSLFIRPNSTVVSLAHDPTPGIELRVFLAFGWLLPAMLLGVIFGLLMRKDANRVGLSPPYGMIWFWAGILLGPVAYLTYRLTRPKVSLVTCENCGKPRRADFERCHLCNTGWDVPELQVPTWRICTSKTTV